MAEITAQFCNKFGESRWWTILDVGRDPNIPIELFANYLAPDECAGPFTLYSSDGQYGLARWVLSDGSMAEVEVVDGARVNMYGTPKY
jgi:hypothetical protein